ANRAVNGRDDQKRGRVVHAEMPDPAGKRDHAGSKRPGRAVVNVEAIARARNRVRWIDLPGEETDGSLCQRYDAAIGGAGSQGVARVCPPAGVRLQHAQAWLVWWH